MFSLLNRFEFPIVDPMSEKYYSWSPYVYVTNNPMRFTDPKGMWKKDGNGNLVAEDKDTDETLAKYLNTTKEIAISMMLEQKFSTNKKGDAIMGTGDVFEIGNDSYGEKIGGYGGEIQSQAGSQFSKDMFWNYWNGKGDVDIKGQRFASILMYLKENKSVPTDLDSKGDKITGKVVSFYESEEYALVFGRATVYYDPKGRVVGLFDNYDFDSKSFGTRSPKNEIKTRLVNFFSPSFSKPFNIRYGKSK